MVPSRQELLELYRDLRVTDVADGLQQAGYHDIMQMSPHIRPLFRDTEAFAHRIVGFAFTYRFLPTNKKLTGPMDRGAFDQWKRNWYRNLATSPSAHALQEHDVIVIDAPDSTAGFIGSNNSLGWWQAGAVGVVTNGGARDTDEIIKTRFPVYCRQINRGIKPGRLEKDAEQIPINCGGVQVRPGDLLVADGDGVVVVPIEDAVEVGRTAREIHDGDQLGRRRKYEALGLPLDETVAEDGA